LKNEGIRTALVSNWDVRCRDLVDDLGLGSVLDELVISSEIGAEKPDRRVFLTALGRLDVEPDRALMVGDSRRIDLRPAEELGMRSALIREPREETWELLKRTLMEETSEAGKKDLR
jgi:putative hydrolase of the HAD superfamily